MFVTSVRVIKWTLIIKQSNLTRTAHLTIALCYGVHNEVHVNEITIGLIGVLYHESEKQPAYVQRTYD